MSKLRSSNGDSDKVVFIVEPDDMPIELASDDDEATSVTVTREDGKVWDEGAGEWRTP